MKILYFVRGGVPTAEQKAEAAGMGAFIRNANVTASDFVEHCDAVAGDVPEAYAKFSRAVPGKYVDEPDAGRGEAVKEGGKARNAKTERESKPLPAVSLE